MGLGGTGAKKKPIKATRLSSSKQSAWKHKRSRVARVIAFLESLPITKGIYAGRTMKLLPSQREFVQAVYGRVSADGRRRIRIAIKSAPRGSGKTGFISGETQLTYSVRLRGLSSCAGRRRQLRRCSALARRVSSRHVEAVEQRVDRRLVSRSGQGRPGG
jgi:phage terminase large subunit-like protein